MFWRRTLEQGDVAEKDLEIAVGLITDIAHSRITIKRARHYGAIARTRSPCFPTHR